MKKAKSFTDGMAIFLAILIMIYLLTGYVKYNPGTQDSEDDEPTRFLDSGTNRQYLNIALMLAFSAATGIILRRKPGLAVLTSALTLGYVLTILDNNLLNKYPMVVTLFCLCHAAGTFVYAASEDRRTGSYSCLGGGLLCAGGCFILTSHTAILQNTAASVAGYVETLSAEGLAVPVRLQPVRGVVDMIYVRYLSGGISSAQNMSNIFSNRYSMEGIKLFYHNSIDGEQYTVYLRLSLLLLSAAVLAPVLRRRRLPAMLVTLLPVIYAFVQLQRDCLSTMPLLVLTLCAFCAFGGIVSFDQHGLAPVSQVERREYLEETAADAAEPLAGEPLAAGQVDEAPDGEGTGDRDTFGDDDEEEEEIYYT